MATGSTETVTMWGLFWKGTDVLAIKRPYRSKGACANAVWNGYDKIREPGEGYVSAKRRWQKMPVEERYALHGLELRPVFSFEFSEVKP